MNPRIKVQRDKVDRRAGIVIKKAPIINLNHPGGGLWFFMGAVMGAGILEVFNLLFK